MVRRAFASTAVIGLLLLPTRPTAAQPAEEPHSEGVEESGKTASGLASGTPAVHQAVESDDEARDLKVLFVGNSYSRHNDLVTMVEELADADPNAPRIEGQLVFIEGATLADHWRTRRVATHLREHDYTHVVLQGASLDAIERPELLRQYARRFDRVASVSGAQTVLYATWARHPDSSLYRRGTVGHNPAQMTARIQDVYAELAEDLDAELAPVGAAWNEALQDRPDRRLHAEDGSHPTKAGSYLAACVLYAALTGESPMGNAYRPRGLSPARIRALQEAAAATLADNYDQFGRN